MILWKNSFKNIKKNLVSFFSLFFMMLISSMVFGIIANSISQLQYEFNKINIQGQLEQAYLPDIEKYKINDGHGYTPLSDEIASTSILNSQFYQNDNPFIFDFEHTLTASEDSNMYDFISPNNNVDKAVPFISENNFHDKDSDGTIDKPFEVYLTKNYMSANNFKTGSKIHIGSLWFTILGPAIVPVYISPIVGGNAFQDYAKSSFCLVSENTLQKLGSKLVVQVLIAKTELVFRFNNIVRGDSKNFEAAFSNLNRTLSQNIRDIKHPLLFSAELVKSWESRIGIRKIISLISAEKTILAFFVIGVCSICIFSLVVILKKLIQENLTQIGVLKAIGYRKFELLINYSIFAIFCGFLSGLFGSILGFGMQAIMNSILNPQFSFNLKNNYLDFYVLATSFAIPLLVMTITAFIYNFLYIRKNVLSLIKKFSNKKTKVNPVLGYITVKADNLPFATKFVVLNFFRSFEKVIIIFISILFSSFLMMFSIISSGAVYGSVRREYASLNYNFSVEYDKNEINNPAKSKFLIRNYDLTSNFTILNANEFLSGYYKDTYKMDNHLPGIEKMGHFLDGQWFNDFLSLHSPADQEQYLESLYTNNFKGLYLLNRDMDYKYLASSWEAMQQIKDYIESHTFPSLEEKVKAYIVVKLGQIVSLFKAHVQTGHTLKINLGFTTYNLNSGNNYEFSCANGNWKYLDGKDSKNNLAKISGFDPDNSLLISNFLSNFSQSQLTDINNWHGPSDTMPVLINVSMLERNKLHVGDVITFNGIKCEILGTIGDYSDNQMFTSKKWFDMFINNNENYKPNAVMTKNIFMSNYLQDNISFIVSNDSAIQEWVKSPIVSIFDKVSVLEGLKNILSSTNFLLAITIFVSVILSLALIFSITNLVFLENKKYIMIMQTIGYRTWEINFLFIGIYLFVIIISAISAIPLASLILNFFGEALTNALSIYLDFSVSFENIITNFFITLIILIISFSFGKKIIKNNKLSEILKSFEL